MAIVGIADISGVVLGFAGAQDTHFTMSLPLIPCYRRKTNVPMTSHDHLKLDGH